MDRKAFQLEECKADESGVIEGYGAVFGVPDLGGDVVQKGAFRASLKSGRFPKMLYQHDPRSVIGVWEEVKEDGEGLRVKGRILTAVQAGREAYELVRAGALDGLSIGYRTVKASNKDGTRLIAEAELWEVSLVTFPMNESARIDAVKAAGMTEREIEQLLVRDAGLSRSVARGLLAGGYDAIKSLRDADGVAEELADLLRARCKL